MENEVREMNQMDYELWAIKNKYKAYFELQEKNQKLKNEYNAICNFAIGSIIILAIIALVPLINNCIFLINSL